MALSFTTIKKQDHEIGLKKKAHYINCKYILFTNLPWPGDSEGVFKSNSRLSTTLPFLLLNVESNREAANTNFSNHWLSRLGIEPESTVSVENSPHTRPLIAFNAARKPIALLSIRNSVRDNKTVMYKVRVRHHTCVWNISGSNDFSNLIHTLKVRRKA